MELVLILSPITGVFAIAVLKNVLDEQKVKIEEDAVSNAFAIFSISIPAIFVALIIYIIATYPFGVAR